MIDDMLPRQSGRGVALGELAREDLDLHSVEELQERIEQLQAEIDRAQAKLEGKQARMSAADALFSIKGA